MRADPPPKRSLPSRPAAEVRAELDTAPVHYARYGREYLGWGVFALMRR